jgi:uncharacterized protein (DUF952 family)
MNQELTATPLLPEPTSILICQNRTCRKQGAAAILTAFRAVERSDLTSEGCGCLGNCGNGPIVLVLPARIWYYRVQPQDVSTILDRLIIKKSMNTILHITQRQAWGTAKNLGTYQSNTLATEGFIHCSTVSQVIGSANRFFKSQADLVVLLIDIDRVNAEIRYEGVDPANLFPHIYGELNIDAVIGAIDLEADTNGSFILPQQLVD